MEEIIKKLNNNYLKMIGDELDKEEIQKEIEFLKNRGLRGWEAFFVPEVFYYDDVLKSLKPNDVVFDVGAGDLRFDLMLSEKVSKVYAVEVNPTILADALKIIGYDLPNNLIVICGNAFRMELPSDVTVVTCLMIHRNHEFPSSWKKQAKIIYTTLKGMKIYCDLKSKECDSNGETEND